MATAAKKTRITPEDYLARERLAEFKSEYCDGQIYAMSGASIPHNSVTGNFFAEIHSRLKGRDCRVFGSDMRVAADPSGLYTYPDVSALCGKAEILDGHLDTLLNPSLIVEVLSPSTEKWDRGGKSARYRRLESLRDLVLVSQDQVLVELYSRREGGWHFTEYRVLDDVLRLGSIDCAITLRDIYDKVDLPDGAAGPDA